MDAVKSFFGLGNSNSGTLGAAEVPLAAVRNSTTTVSLNRKPVVPITGASKLAALAPRGNSALAPRGNSALAPRGNSALAPLTQGGARKNLRKKYKMPGRRSTRRANRKVNKSRKASRKATRKNRKASRKH